MTDDFTEVMKNISDSELLEIGIIIFFGIPLIIILKIIE